MNLLQTGSFIIMNKNVKRAFAAAALSVPVISGAASLSLGYTLTGAALVAGGTTLVSAASTAIGAAGGIGLAALFNKHRGGLGFEGLGPAMLGAFVGGASGLIAGGLLGFNILTNSLDDIDSIQIKEKPAAEYVINQENPPVLVQSKPVSYTL
jgi:hypothetical protein